MLEEGTRWDHTTRTSLVPRLVLTGRSAERRTKGHESKDPNYPLSPHHLPPLRWPSTNMSLRNSISDLKKRLGRRLTINRRELEEGADAGGEGVDQPGSPPKPEPYVITEGGNGHLQSRNEADANGRRFDPPDPPPRSGGSGNPVLRSRRGDDEGERETVIEEKIRKRDLRRTLGVEDSMEGGPSQKGGRADQLNPRLRSTSSVSHGAESKSMETTCYFCCCF